MRFIRILLLSAIALAGLPVGLALAQYPEPVGACTVSSKTLDVTPNTTIDLIVTVQNASGKPLGGTAGSVGITSQPGQGATVVVPNFTTGADGTATISLKTGNAAGSITLALTCGTLSASTVVKVAVGATIPKPPDTGTGGAGTEDGSQLALLLGLSGAGVLLLGGGAFVVRRRRR